MKGLDISVPTVHPSLNFQGKHGLDCYLKITETGSYNSRWNSEDNKIALRLAEEAVGMCPENPLSYSTLGWVYHHAYFLGNSPREALERGLELAQKALALDDSLASAHGLLGLLYAAKGEHDKAIAEGERAVSLSPGGSEALTDYAWSLNAARRWEEAIPHFEKAVRLNPIGKSCLYRGYGMALLNTNRLEEAVSALKTSIQRSPNDLMALLQRHTA